MSRAKTHDDALAVLSRRRNDQILRTVPILGGLSGGDSELGLLLRNSGPVPGAACAEIKTLERARSPLRDLDIATNCGDKACLQHECEAGMAELSHILAIFKQQLCSASFISRPSATQATRGSPKSSSISAAATIFEALLNIVILPHYAKKIAFNADRFSQPGTGRKGDPHLIHSPSAQRLWPCSSAT